MATDTRKTASMEVAVLVLMAAALMKAQMKMPAKSALS
jgi:hypothetical protein